MTNLAESTIKFKKLNIMLGLGDFAGSHEIFTPEPLVEEILDTVIDGEIPQKILVLYNLEFVVSLLYTYNIPAEDITVYVDHDVKRRLAEKMGVNILKGNLIKEMNDMKFDVVVGNPPFQSGKGNGSQPLYKEIVAKSLDIVNPDGYVAIITPPGIFSATQFEIENPILRTIKNGNLTKVRLDLQESEFEGKIGYFPSAKIHKICYFIWQHSRYNGNTCIRYKDSICNIDIAHKFFISTIHSDCVDSIYTKATSKSNKLNLKYRKVTSGIHVRFKEMNSESGKIKAQIADEYSNAYAFTIPCASLKEAEHICDFLNSKYFTFVNLVIKFNGVNHAHILNGFSIPDQTIDCKNVVNIYQWANLTDEEIEYIENNTK